MITLDRVSVARGRRAILHDITFSAPQGKVTVVIGPNGSGKSTLIGAMGGTLAYGGSIRLYGHEISRTPPAQQAGMRAVMAQHTDLSFSFSVGQVVAMGADGAEDQRRVPDLLAQLGLAGFAPRSAAALSGGEAQRMHLARALLQAERAQGGAGWLFLDEPVASLDLGQQLAVMSRAQAHAQAGGGVLAVLHDLNLAAMYADQLVVIDQGRLIAAGPPDSVLTSALIERVYGCHVPLNTAPRGGVWFSIQAARHGGWRPGSFPPAATEN